MKDRQKAAKQPSRKVGLTVELSEEWMEAIRTAKVPDEFAYLDAELERSKS